MANFEKTQINPDGIGTILTNKRLSVPAYQRNYSWERQNVSQFLTDIINAFTKHESEYFLGTIVLVQQPDGKLEIVDGQQRLATTELFISVIRDYLISKGDNDRAPLIEKEYLFSTDIKSLKNKFHLQLNSEDNPHFEKFIKDSNTPVGKNDPRSAKLMSDAVGEIKRHINDLATNDPQIINTLMDILEYIRDNVMVIAITVSDTANAFTIFETLNDRGLDLSTADLLKNYLFGLSGDRIEEAKQQWIQIVSTLSAIGDESLLPKFIHYYWISANGDVTQSGLFDAIKQQVQIEEDAISFLQKLSDSARHFVSMQNPLDDRWTTMGEATQQSIIDLKRIPLDQIKPLLLAVITNFSDRQLITALRRMVSWTVRFHIAGDTRSSQFRDKLSQISQSIHRGEIKTTDALYRSLRAEKLLPNNADFEAKFAVITPSQQLARYYLSEIEQVKRVKDGLGAGLEPSPSPDVVSLEHILPKTITDYSQWPDFDSDTASNYVGRLGNLAIMPSKQNSKIGNIAFSEKVKQNFTDSAFVTTKDLASQKKWDSSAIESRQLEQAKLASKAWPLEES